MKNRKNIRLKHYDYSNPGYYFVTICTKDRINYSGEIVEGEMELNDAGKMVARWYFKIENKFQEYHCDYYVIMPNHIHFIIHNVGADLRVCPKPPDPNNVGADLRVCPINQTGEHAGSPLQKNINTIGEHMDLGEHIGTGEHAGSPLHRVVQWFKTMTTNEYIRGVKHFEWVSFSGKLWQRNYYEHITGNEKELYEFRKYIKLNPLKWEFDENNKKIYRFKYEKTNLSINLSALL